MPLDVTVIDCVVAPLVQANELPLDAVSVTLPPAQKVVGPDAVIVAVGAGVTLTTWLALAEQPPESVTVTLKVPLAFTTIDCVMEPFDHEYDVPGLAVSVTLPPAQNVVGPDAVMLAVGVVVTVTVVGAEVAEQPFESVTTTL